MIAPKIAHDDALRAAGVDVYTLENDHADAPFHEVEVRYESHDGRVSVTLTLAPDEARALAAHLMEEAALAEAQDASP